MIHYLTEDEIDALVGRPKADQEVFGVLFEEYRNKLFIEISPDVREVLCQVFASNKPSADKVTLERLVSVGALFTQHDAVVAFHTTSLYRKYRNTETQKHHCWRAPATASTPRRCKVVLILLSEPQFLINRIVVMAGCLRY